MRVLLAVDQSSASDAAATYLLGLPFQQPVDLQIVTVVTPFPFTENQVPGSRPDVGDLLDRERQQVEATLDELVARFQNDTFQSVSAKVIVGTPGQALTEFAKEKGTELIVMGAVGRSALSRVVLGSVSDFVANQAQCSVLIVRSQTSAGVGTVTGTGPKRIMLALENSDQDVEVANCLRQFELPASTQVHAVHVMQLMTFYRQDIIQQTSEMWKESKVHAESHGKLLSEVIRDWGLDTRSSVVSGPHIGDSLLSYAEEHECDLIVSGDRRRGTLKRLFLGSVSRHLLRYAKCSVLISR
ncbi:MAG: universal stress protein, partial [Planctomycetales bacterium]|nr:universal stress protein [Planctomycetales bacterium]